ncbi:YncE family protein [Lysinibacillus piscis]|uniref:YncE family protein n=1 Tax=Lysinibacillus piscis TaxID=2518931 RepID=A0ABQ5NNC9_9BACI|nr:YncE family protein [Lysinibacillus sp. KH24]GLC89865.1 hypothetical protein LYSBPC_29920 [Lysinibacillus sp. KH24]
MIVKKWILLLFLLILITILASCKNQAFEPIQLEQTFIASLNIQDTSLNFIDSQGTILKTWSFDKAYTGATLLGPDQLLLFGHQLDQIDVYTLSTGQKLYSKKVKLGTTNVYYADKTKQFFIANSMTNTVTSFDEHGKELVTQQVGNYPMSMEAFQDHLYVINFKDTTLSVLAMKDLSVEQEWTIPKSAHGIAIIEETNELWIGGHGEGSKPNRTIKRYQLETGALVGEIDTPLMPVGLTKTKDAVLVVSHGHNELYVVDWDGHVKWHLEVGANPFVVNQLQAYIVVAGYDDHTLYFIKNGQIEKTVDVGKGAFQLLVREGTS